MSHWLTPLLDPRSIAVVGASPRAGGAGETILRTLREESFPGPVHPVNPRYEAIGELACYPTLADLPERIDLAVLAVSDARIEEQLATAIAAGARAVAIFGSCVLEGDREPALAARLSAMAREANLPICGGNSLGFCHYEAGLRVTSYPFPDRPAGTITFLSQSGSVFGAITNSNRRIGLNLAACTGRELSASVADYMDYAIERPSTRVIGLFLEAIRDPDAFVAALGKAAAREVPVVALKAGRTEKSARMAISHSGALVGDDRAFDALCRRHGILRVDTLDELVATLLLMEQPRRPGPGALVSIHESGGEREMVVDLAEEIGVPFAPIDDATKAKLAARLDPGLVPENPCDAFGTGRDYDGVLRDCFAALLADPAAALGVFFLDLRQDGGYSEGCAQACLDAFSTSEKPVALATNYSAVEHRDVALRITRQGVPVLDGTVPALKAVKHALAYRDWRARNEETPIARLEDGRCDDWRARLSAGGSLDETDSLRLLADYGITVIPHRVVMSREEAIAAAKELGLPAVLKTAAEGVRHKSDVNGVRLELMSEDAVAAAYDDIASRLGARVLVAPQIGGGVEFMIGLKTDPQFGPMVLVSAGGVFVEVLADVQTMLAPTGPGEARAAIDALAARPLLDGARGAPSADVEALIDALVRLSWLAADMDGLIAEADVNPILVRAEGAVALDALVVARPR